MADGVRPPEPDAAGGAGLADVRDTSAPASAPPEPGVGLAAPPGQGRTETRGPSAAPPPQGRRSADADERQGPARLCLGAAPLAGLRQAPARRRRPPADWASEGAPLLAPREAAGADVTRGWDQRPTPPHGAFYAAFAAARARASLTRLHCGAPRHTAVGCLAPTAHGVAARARGGVTVAAVPCPPCKAPSPLGPTKRRRNNAALPGNAASRTPA